MNGKTHSVPLFAPSVTTQPKINHSNSFGLLILYWFNNYELHIEILLMIGTYLLGQQLRKQRNKCFQRSETMKIALYY